VRVLVVDIFLAQIKNKLVRCMNMPKPRVLATPADGRSCPEVAKRNEWVQPDHKGISTRRREPFCRNGTDTQGYI